MVISGDRGQAVRRPDEYARLAGERFATVQAEVRSNLLRIPYTHCVIEAIS
jgi:hypothetical protein